MCRLRSFCPCLCKSHDASDDDGGRRSDSIRFVYSYGGWQTTTTTTLTPTPLSTLLCAQQYCGGDIPSFVKKAQKMGTTHIYRFQYRTQQKYWNHAPHFKSWMYRVWILCSRECVCHNRRTIAIKTQHKKLAHGVNWAHFPSLLHFSHESMRDLRGCLFASNMLPMARSTGRYFELCELCAWRRVDVYELGTAVKCSQLKSNVERFAVYTMKLFYSFIKRRKTISKSTR